VTAGSILVVDDDAAIRGVVRAILRRHGFVVDEAAGGHEAIARIEQQRFDVLLLDLLMGSGGGEDVLAALNAVRPGAKCVVIMSAASPAKLAALESPNVAAKLRKPFDIDALLDAVQSCCPPSSN